MSILEAIVLGIVQGFSEFLPISSSGHLVMLQKLFNINESTMSFDIALHFATLIAVLIIYRKVIWEMIKKPFSKLPMFLVLGTLPIIFLGLLFDDTIEGFFDSGSTLGIGFLITGFVLFISEKIVTSNKKIKEMKIKDPIVIGTAQAIAMIPAVSRSGMTISASLFMGLNKKFAADFSFLLSLPAIIGAVVLDLYKMTKHGGGFTFGMGIIPVLAGMIAAAICGFIAIKLMIRIITNKKLKYFSYYVFILAGIIIIDQLFFGFVF